MGLDAIGIKRNRVLVPLPVRVLPGEPIILWAKLGVVGGDVARFTISTVADVPVFGPADQRTDFFSEEVNLYTVAPPTAGFYLLKVTELRPLFPDDTLVMGFEVSPDAPPPPPSGGGPFGKYTPWIIGGALLIGLVAIAPSLKNITEKR
jgi:hypothetical protein